MIFKIIFSLFVFTEGIIVFVYTYKDLQTSPFKNTDDFLYMTFRTGIAFLSLAFIVKMCIFITYSFLNSQYVLTGLYVIILFIAGFAIRGLDLIIKKTFLNKKDNYEKK